MSLKLCVCNAAPLRARALPQTHSGVSRLQSDWGSRELLANIENVINYDTVGSLSSHLTPGPAACQIARAAITT